MPLTVTRIALAMLTAVTLAGCEVASAATPSATATAAPSALPSPVTTPSAPPTTGPSVPPTPLPTPAPTPPAIATPSPKPVETPGRTTPPAAYCNVADIVTPNTSFDDHASTYLDWTYRLPAEYAPSDLVNAITGKPAAGAPLAIRALAYGDLARLRAAALAAGYRLEIVSAYRSYAQQAQTFDYWTRVGGYEQALRTSARAGHSEHQLGTAIDFGDGTAAPWDYTDWATTPAGAWLAAHGAEYGFVMTYPRGKTAATCYSYEPWHYRYVGADLAMALATSGLSLREFQSISALRA
jgi:zinc D-Ala-D-Ala carboxypeptidase